MLSSNKKKRSDPYLGSLRSPGTGGFALLSNSYHLGMVLTDELIHSVEGGQSKVLPNRNRVSFCVDSIHKEARNIIIPKPRDFLGIKFNLFYINFLASSSRVVDVQHSRKFRLTSDVECLIGRGIPRMLRTCRFRMPSACPHAVQTISSPIAGCLPFRTHLSPTSFRSSR